MALSNTEVQKRLTDPKNKNQILKAIQHEQWLKFHAQEALKWEWASQYKRTFDLWVAGLLPSDKAAFFKLMMTFPLYTNELCTSMQDEFNKVFDSQNSSFTYDFTNESNKRDFVEYLDEEDFWLKWKDQAKGSMLKRVSSVCIIDMPKEPSFDLRPYFYFQDISGVIDLDYMETEDTTRIMMIAIKQDEDNILVIDELSYRGFKKDGTNWIFSYEVKHELGYCPACFFWNEAICKEEPIVKKSAITGALNNLDYLLFMETSRRCAEMYAGFPIVVSYKENCTYYKEIDWNGNRGNYYCKSGLIDTPQGVFNCPVCEKNRMLGAGTKFSVTPPKSKDDPNNIDAVRFISTDVESMDYLDKRVSGLKDSVYYACVGNSVEAMTQAINEDQVQGNFESKHNTIMKIAGNMTPSTNFVLYTIAKLRYGVSFVDLSYSYGTRFYLQTAQQAQDEYKSAVDSKVPVYLLGYKRQQVDMANTKGNPVDAQKLEILQDLEPWVDYDINQAKALGMMEIDPKGYLLKADFTSRVKQFEANFGSIVEFGSKLPYATKIDKIKTILFTYGAQAIPKPPEQKPVI